MRRLVAVGTAAAVVAVGAVAAVAAEGGPPAEVVAAAKSAATDARDAARALAVQAQQDDEVEVEDESEGEPQGKGTAAFQERHAALAAKHADKPGNAARVHQALADGESPSGLGQEQAAANKAMKEARKALKSEGEKPGRGLGRDKNATEDAEGS